MELVRNPPSPRLFFIPLLLCLACLLVTLVELYFLALAFFLFGILFLYPFILLLTWIAGRGKGLEEGLARHRKRTSRRKTRRIPYEKRLEKEILGRFPPILAFGLPGLTYHLGYQSGNKEANRVRPLYVPPPPTLKPALSQELTLLAELHKKGALTDEEFAKAKARLLRHEPP